MRDDFRSLAEIFDNDPGLGNLRKAVQQFDVVDSFEKIFPDLVKIVQPVKTEKKILFLRVENSVWRSELRFSEKVIVEKVNKFFNEVRIKGVRFVP
jgi:restriction endonuclease